MFRKIACAAFMAASVAVLAQTESQTTTTTTNPVTGTTRQVTTTTTTNAPAPYSSDDWRVKYDEYHIGNVDVNSINPYGIFRVAEWNLRGANAGDKYTITDFLMRLPADEEYVMCKALVNNWKQACAIRDEVAMARFGNPEDYTWLTYPPLTWTETPGQSSWSTMAFMQPGATTTTTTTTVTTEAPIDESITMTYDQSRPMRLIMAHKVARGDIDSDQAVDILCAGMDDTDRGVIRNLFHPEDGDATSGFKLRPLTYTNSGVLDAITRVIEQNADMVHHLDRYAWYNHFASDYYSRRSNWDY